MSGAVAVAFNLLVNGAISFGMALGLTRLFARVLKLQPGPLRLTLWLAPVAKSLWDLGRGVPKESFVWVYLLGVKQELGSFQVGVGIKKLAPPYVHATLAAHAGGRTYPQSLADLLYRALSIKISVVVPSVVVLVLLAVGAYRVAQRIRSVLIFRREARDVLSRSVLQSAVGAASRSVRVYVSDDYEGAPFAAGIVHPFIVFSRRSFESLDEESRAAAVAHELAHIERRDPLLILSLLLFGDFFWFFPGVAWLLRRNLGEIELCADRHAVRSGAHPVALADALLHSSELLRAAPAPALGLGGKSSLLSERVRHLLEPSRPSSRASSLTKILIVFLFLASILHSLFLGN